MPELTPEQLENMRTQKPQTQKTRQSQSSVPIQKTATTDTPEDVGTLLGERVATQNQLAAQVLNNATKRGQDLSIRESMAFLTSYAQTSAGLNQEINSILREVQGAIESPLEIPVEVTDVQTARDFLSSRLRNSFENSAGKA